MTDEKEKTVDALKIAIQMEIDGKEFYITASQKSDNKAGEDLFARLAEEEDIHLKLFEEIFSSIRDKKGWPDVDYTPDRGQALRTVFAEAMDTKEIETTTLASELDAVNKARQMEARTYDFYTRRSQGATEAAEKEFYDLVAIQEQNHNLILADYYEYLQNPAGWFVKKEHPHLD